jgi:NitT/TauT family transport system substrate-binding protein
MKNIFRFSLLLAMGLIATLSQAIAAELNFGKPGDAIKLIVGYQPYYTESWSGIVMRDKKFYEKYLPKGSTVEFQIGLQGSIIVNAMIAGKQHIGYMGDMPAIIATTKNKVADIRIVATLGFGYDQCNILLARKDAPEFKDAKAAIQWLNGKQVAVPQGACADRFTRALFKKENITPAAYLNQNIEVITSGFRAGKLDAAAIWEPTASRIVEDGLARRIASGASVNEHDAAFLTMRAELIAQRPDVVKAWLQAELDAQLFLAESKNASEVVRMAREQTTGFSEKSLWKAAYGSYPASVGGVPVRMQLPYGITPEVTALIGKSAAFLYELKSIKSATLRPEAVMPEFTQAILAERKLKSPIGEVKALSDAEMKSGK